MFKGAVLRYLISDALSMLGNSIAGVVLPLVLLARTGDVLAAGSLALICAVPQFVFGLLGGAVLDRVDRKLVCVVSDLVSALLGFFAFDRVSDERRGSAMGTLNALYLVVAPAGTFMGSALLSALDLKGTGIALTAAWIVVTAAALVAPALRDLGDARGADVVQQGSDETVPCKECE